MDLGAIKHRAERATTGPWKVDVSENFGKDWPITTGTLSSDNKVYHVATNGIPGSYLNDGNAKTDAEFIAHARTDIPELLAELTRLTALLEDRQGLRNVIRRASWEFDDDSPKRMARSEYLADRLIAYLKPLG